MTTSAPSIEAQYDEVCREIRQRERLYARWLEEARAGGRPRITDATAERKLGDLRAAAKTLRFVADHASGLRALVHYLRGSTDPVNPEMPTDADRAALMGHPGVQALVAAWPEAELVGIRPIQPPEQPELFTEPAEEPA